MSLETLEAADNWSTFRNAIRSLSDKAGEWAGIPVPIEGREIVIEKRFPHAETLTRIYNGEKEEKEEKEDNRRLRNIFWSAHYRSAVVVFEENGKVDWGFIPGTNHLGFDLDTLDASVAWGIEQESRALQLLGSMLRHSVFKKYLLTGMFLEQSSRTGIHYLFRRLKPTVALRVTEEGGARILAALCLHPIAYYAGSWAGAMCPTDDVIAHLVLMRGDEPLFWRRANQHPPGRPEAAI